MLPRYRQLELALVDFAQVIEGYCSGPSGPGMQVTREKFHVAMDAWFAIQHVHFDPITYFNRVHRLYFWPGARAKVADGLAKINVLQMTDSEIAAYIADAGVPVQGLMAPSICYTAKVISVISVSTLPMDAVWCGRIEHG